MAELSGDALQALRTPAGRRDPYPVYAALHRLGPAFAPPSAPDGGPSADGAARYAVVACGYAAVDQVLRDPRFGVTDRAAMDSSSPGWREHQTLATLMESMVFTNPPAHGRMRRAVGQVFTARRVASLEPAIHALVDGLLDRLAAAGAGGVPVDFMAELAFPLPSDVIGELLGVPPPDRAWFRPLVEAVGRVLDLGGTSAQAMEEADRATTALCAYFADLAATRRVEPRDDLVSQLVADRPADVLSDDELLGNLVVLFNAGFVTTTHLLGNGLRLLLEHPTVLSALRERPALVPAFVDEVLRYEAPVQLLTRWASVEAEVASLPVPRGGRVLLLLGAANRDPVRFPDPDTFDVRRPDNQPLSFGAGAHYCIGAALSRLEAQVAFPKLLARFPRLAAAGPATLSDQLTLRGFSHLPVVVS